MRPIRRKPNVKEKLSHDIPNLYRKRLRSWKRKSVPFESNRQFSRSSISHHIDKPLPYRSTIYRYPMTLYNDLSNTTTSSIFYCPSISNITTKKRKSLTSLSCEHLSNRLSPTNTLDILTNLNNAMYVNTNQSHIDSRNNEHHQKRSRMSMDDSMITNHHSIHTPIFTDKNTIDINQCDQNEQHSSSFSTNETQLDQKSTSMEVAVKMVQPIVDIIFNAFENQFKNIQTTSLQSSSSRCSSLSSLRNMSQSQFDHQILTPYFPITSSIRPIVLHAVDFNIPLTRKTYSNSNDVITNQNHQVQSMSLTKLKQKLISCTSSNHCLADRSASENSHTKKGHKLKRIAQLTVFGVSILCGYLLL